VVEQYCQHELGNSLDSHPWKRSVVSVNLDCSCCRHGLGRCDSSALQRELLPGGEGVFLPSEMTHACTCPHISVLEQTRLHLSSVISRLPPDPCIWRAMFRNTLDYFFICRLPQKCHCCCLCMGALAECFDNW
jgi:hypothetical protein